MTASRIASKLYQGSLPPSAAVLRAQGIHTIVLCAIELQPDDWQFEGAVDVIRCPFDDNGDRPSARELARIEETALAVAARVRRSQRALVTCAQGRNRSGLVGALALIDLYRISGKEAVTWVQRMRENALTNTTFVELLERVPSREHIRERLAL